MPNILVFSGVGPYADPWHPFPETSAAIASVLRDAGHDVVVRDSLPGSLLDLERFDLLVVNSGGRLQEPDAARTRSWAQDHEALGEFHGTGHPVLGVHTAVATFPDWPGWGAIIGGRWGKDAHHPPMDEATFHPASDARQHPVWDGLQSVTAVDERYSFLEVFDGSLPLVLHDTDGRQHVMGWAVGDTVVYDGLGHDLSSYQSPERRRLLVNEVDWLLGRRRGAATTVSA